MLVLSSKCALSPIAANHHCHHLGPSHYLLFGFCDSHLMVSSFLPYLLTVYLNTAAKIILLKCESDHVTLLLNTSQGLLHSVWVKAKVPTMVHRKGPPLSDLISCSPLSRPLCPGTLAPACHSQRTSCSFSLEPSSSRCMNDLLPHLQVSVNCHLLNKV